MTRFRTIGLVPFALAVCGCAGMSGVNIDARVPSNPDTVVWGYLPAGRAPVLTVRSGQTVEIDTVSHQGLINGTDPVSFFGVQGIAANEVLPDAIAIYSKAPRPKDAGAHVLTGPIAIDGAEAGDMLEVRMVDFRFRTPYGVNNSNKGTGVLPDLHAKPYPKVIRFDVGRRVALFAPGIEVPLVPFMGILAVMPPEALANTRPPGIYGGNMDFNRLTVGARLYLPVHQRGALFYTGDSHAVQGDGEINGTAIEASLTALLQFTLHKGGGKTMKWPRAEDAENFYVMGMDVDLDAALKQAAEETVNFLQREKGLSAADAYALASIAVNYTVGEAVDQVQMVYGAIPKKLFVK
ncbi:MAG TPA: acetamidase/formamidase family protein [Burkholderiales bacterium]|jgi:acetamidase/formamidase|nr:acetamidase/formamidase family protein [Burkholderiales bacterium]